MSSDNDVSALLANSDSGVNENSSDQNSVESCSDGLMLSDGSHMGSVSVDSIDPDSIGNHLTDSLVDQPQQEKGAGGLNSAVEMRFGLWIWHWRPRHKCKDGGLGIIPKGRSIAHNIFYNQHAIFLSFDIEMGEIAGIVQIEIVRPKVGSDHTDNIIWEEAQFNRYINLEVCSEYWDQHSISVHGILPLPDDERIINAGNMRTVLP